ncbi:MAG TPA: inositol monophosphatase family protein [Acidobacteriota bacterium]
MNAARYQRAAAEVAAAAGELLLRRFRKPLAMRHKQRRGAINLVTEADLAAERFIRRELERRCGPIPFVGEESGGSERAAERWIVDPIDGTTNYAHGHPFFAVSIAYEREGGIVAGAVCAPALGELFEGRRGGGAYRGRKRLVVSNTRKLDQAVVATGFGYDVHQHPQRYLNAFGRIMRKAGAVRRDGAAAIDLSYVAAGRFDGFWETNLKAWDTAAGLLLVEEAGGRISDYAGRSYRPGDRTILATNGRLHRSMQQLLNR